MVPDSSSPVDFVAAASVAPFVCVAGAVFAAAAACDKSVAGEANGADFVGLRTNLMSRMLLLLLLS